MARRLPQQLSGALQPSVAAGALPASPPRLGLDVARAGGGSAVTCPLPLRPSSNQMLTAIGVQLTRTWRPACHEAAAVGVLVAARCVLHLARSLLVGYQGQQPHAASCPAC